MKSLSRLQDHYSMNVTNEQHIPSPDRSGGRSLPMPRLLSAVLRTALIGRECQRGAVAMMRALTISMFQSCPWGLRLAERCETKGGCDAATKEVL
jgi:hypothetical protein